MEAAAVRILALGAFGGATPWADSGLVPVGCGIA
jgi:hypothetical protein